TDAHSLHFILAVNLGALQAIGVVDVERLPLGIEVQRRIARLAMAVAGLFCASKGQMDLRPNGRRVYVDNSGMQVAHSLEGSVYVLSVDRGRKTVAHSVGDFDGLLETVNGH